MRVRFFQPTDEQETAEFLALKRKIAAFWLHFQKVCHLPGAQWIGQLRHALKDINDALGFEVDDVRTALGYEGDAGEKFAYVISLDGPSFRPLAQAVVAEAPSIWPWVIASEREPVELDRALQRTFADTKFDLKTARARVGVGRGHGIEVIIAHHLFHGTHDEAGGQVGEQLVTTLLGDELFDGWITSVEVMAAPRPSPLRLVTADNTGLPLSLVELQASVQNAVTRITDSLPEEPLHVFCDRADWVLFEMDEMRQGEDVSGLPLPDLQMATTLCPEMLKSYLSGIPFASRRFSRHGERFVYLELAFGDASDNVRLAHRMALEEALDYALVPGRLGCVVGAGVGSEHMYVFLALHNLKPALATLNRCLFSQEAGFNACLRFCDDEWAMEWVEFERLFLANR
jgi:hypothetical protein